MLITRASVLLEGVTVSDRLLLSLDFEVVLIVALGFGFLGIKNLAIVRFHKALLLESPRLDYLPVKVLRGGSPFRSVGTPLDLTGANGGHRLPVELTGHLAINVGDKRTCELDRVR